MVAKVTMQRSVDIGKRSPDGIASLDQEKNLSKQRQKENYAVIKYPDKVDEYLRMKV